MKNVLIVDDNEQDLYLMRVLLEGHGYTVVSASNGEEALKAAHETPPDIMISDIMMPGMDGFVLCREWMGDDRLKSIPFVFYTATYTDAQDEELALGLGATRFVVKPTEPNEFIEIIRGVARDLEEGKIKPGTPTPETDEQMLKLYDERLIRKLEEKVLELKKETANRERTEKKLAEHREHLEERVRDRTEELRKTVNLMAGRENRMAELKRAIKKLRAQLEEAGMTPVAGDPLISESDIAPK